MPHVTLSSTLRSRAVVVVAVVTTLAPATTTSLFLLCKPRSRSSLTTPCAIARAIHAAMRLMAMSVRGMVLPWT